MNATSRKENIGSRSESLSLFLTDCLENHDPIKYMVQFGDDNEVIYLGTESEDRQHEWIKALKKGEVDPCPVGN